MEKTTRHVLKADNVKMEGRFQLGLDQAAASLQPKPRSTAVVEPMAHIVENYPEFAVVEVTCSCGEKMRLKCEYAGTDVSAGQVPEQTQ